MADEAVLKINIQDLAGGASAPRPAGAPPTPPAPLSSVEDAAARLGLTVAQLAQAVNKPGSVPPPKPPAGGDVLSMYQPPPAPPRPPRAADDEPLSMYGPKDAINDRTDKLARDAYSRELKRRQAEAERQQKAEADKKAREEHTDKLVVENYSRTRKRLAAEKAVEEVRQRGVEEQAARAAKWEQVGGMLQAAGAGRLGGAISGAAAAAGPVGVALLAAEAFQEAGMTVAKALNEAAAFTRSTTHERSALVRGQIRQAEIAGTNKWVGLAAGLAESNPTPAGQVQGAAIRAGGNAAAAFKESFDKIQADMDERLAAIKRYSGPVAGLEARRAAAQQSYDVREAQALSPGAARLSRERAELDRVQAQINALNREDQIGKNVEEVRAETERLRKDLAKRMDTLTDVQRKVLKAMEGQAKTPLDELLGGLKVPGAMEGGAGDYDALGKLRDEVIDRPFFNGL